MAPVLPMSPWRVLPTLLWVAFLAAAVAEGCVFSLFDPQQLSASGVFFGWSPIALYSIGFLFLWSCCLLSGALSYLLLAPNRVSGAL